MKSILRMGLLFGTVGMMGAGLGCSAAPGNEGLDQASDDVTAARVFADGTGQVAVVSTAATIDTGNPFFQNLGANGRTCNSCHKLEAALGISAAQIQAIFNQSQGLDPIFRINDGSNAPSGFF